MAKKTLKVEDISKPSEQLGNPTPKELMPLPYPYN